MRRTPVRVLGIDPSLTSTGVAWIDEDGYADAYTIPTHGSRRDDLIERAERIRYITATATPGEDGYLLAAIEAPSFGSVGGSAWDRAGVWWGIVHRLIRDDIPVATVAPATRARWATGNGRSDKAAVSGAMARLWPAVECRNSDEADALALATMAAQHAGFTVPKLERHAAALTAARWPEPDDDQEAAA